MCMESKDPMGLSAGVVTCSGTSASAMHNGTNTEASATPGALVRSDSATRATHAPSIITPDTSPNAVAPSHTIAPISSHLSTPSPYMSNMSTAIVPVPASGFSFANPSAVLGFESMKKKRGRPRKYGPGGSLALSVTPILTLAPSPFSPSQKRGRGRPPGSGKNQQLAALGELMLGSIGAGFTPHAITVATGEDIASRIMSFSQQGPRGICILSANGAISSVTLRQPSISGGIVTYEGRFEILSLSGSFLLTEFGGARSRTGGLSVSLAGPDGRVVGGGVAGVLIAASPVQVVVGSFMCNAKKLPLPKTARTEAPTYYKKPVTLNVTKPITVNAGNTETDVPMEESESKHVVAESPALDKGAMEGRATSNVASPDGQVTPPPQSVSQPAAQTSSELGKNLPNTDISLPE
eukprot:c33493_g1_i1 orf=275-1501(-)